MQIGGGNCSLCKSPNVTKVTCPLNPTAKNPDPLKHPLASQALVKPSQAVIPVKQPQAVTQVVIPVKQPQVVIPVKQEQLLIELPASPKKIKIKLPPAVIKADTHSYKGDVHLFQESDGRCSFVIYIPQIPQADINMITHELDSIPESEWISGKLFGNPIPRIVRWYQKDGGTYKFSGKKYKSFPYEQWLQEYVERLNVALNEEFQDLECSEFTGFNLNSVLINKYRSGIDSISWHSDDEPEFGLNPTIVSVSLGEPRVFHVRRMAESVREKSWNKRGMPYVQGYQKPEALSFNLGKGNMLIMGGAFQDFWEHSIPKQKELTEPRYNLTFRPYVMK